MGNLYKKITELCNERGIKGAKLCSDTGISKGLLTDLKMGRRTGVSAITAQKIASYFNVSVGYLLGEEDKKENSPDKLALTEGEEMWLDLYRRLSDEGREMLDKSVRLLTSVPDDQQEILVELLRVALKNQQ